MDLINSLLPEIEQFQILGYWVLFLIALLESLAFVGMLVPGTFFIILFGSLAANGYFSLVGLIWFTVAGAALGDIGSYFLGKRGIGFFSEDNRIFRTGYLERGKAFFRKHGARSIFLGRFVGPLRPVIPFIAGLSAMETGKFCFWDILTVVVWAVLHLYLGYLLGHAWRLAEVWLTRIGIFLAAAAIFLFCGYLLKRFLFKKGKLLFAFLGSLLMSAQQSISARPAVRTFVANHPRTVAFLQNRLHTRDFSGLPLTLLGIAFLYTLLLLMGVIGEVVKAEVIVTIDKNVESLLFVFRDPLLVEIFLWITVLGKLKIVLCLAIAATLLFKIWQRESFIVPLWITTGGSYLFIMLGKVTLHRPRPAELAVYSEPFSSFPSGHATIAMALLGYMAYSLCRETDSWKNRINTCFVAGVLILLVGFSRLYLGVHYLSDVLGGSLLGLLWLMIGICIQELRRTPAAATPAPVASTLGLRILTAVILFSASGYYLYSARSFHPPRQVPEQGQATIIVENKIGKIFTLYRLPVYTESVMGKKQEPLNLLIIAKNKETLSQVLTRAGWRKADAVGFLSLARAVNAFIFNKSYPLAPITPAFWNNRVNDLNFVKPSAKHTVRRRHEARFWRTDFRMEDGRRIFLGLARLSVSTGWWIIPIPTEGHHPDRERDALLRELVQAGAVESYNKFRVVPPVSMKTFTGQLFQTDGYMYMIELK
jgi:membrane protein DedA with SNARE-associated domain